MDDPLYREIIMEHFEHPQNYGSVTNPDIDISQVNPLCGDKIRITAKVKNKRIEKIAFEGEGCAISKAAASILMEEVQGVEIEKFIKTKPETFLKLMGIKLTPARLKCALLGFSTLKAGLQKS